MNEPIKWQRNQFVKLYAKMAIRLGGATDVTIAKNDEFETDGTIINYAGHSLPLPGIRTAYERGWATQDEEDLGNPVRPVIPVRNVAKSDTKSTDLSRVQRGNSSAMATDALDEETILKVGDRSAKENYDERGRLVRHITAEDNHRHSPGQRSMRITQSDVDSQDGVVIGSIRTKAKTGAIDVTEHSYLARDLENISTDSGFGQVKRVEKEGVTITSNLNKTRRGIVNDDQDEGRVFGMVRSSQEKKNVGGIEVRDTSSIRNARPAPAPRVSALPTVPKTKAPVKSAAKAPAKPIKAAAKPAKDEILSPRVRIARQFDPSFPSSWEFSGKLADRLNAVKQHGATPEFIQALYAAEGDQMRKVIEKEFSALL